MKQSCKRRVEIKRTRGVLQKKTLPLFKMIGFWIYNIGCYASKYLTFRFVNNSYKSVKIKMLSRDSDVK